MFIILYMVMGIIAFIVGVIYSDHMKPDGMKEHEELLPDKKHDPGHIIFGILVILVLWPIVLPAVLKDDIKTYQIYEQFHKDES